MSRREFRFRMRNYKGIFGAVACLGQLGAVKACQKPRLRTMAAGDEIGGAPALARGRCQMVWL